MDDATLQFCYFWILEMVLDWNGRGRRIQGSKYCDVLGLTIEVFDYCLGRWEDVGT